MKSFINCIYFFIFLSYGCENKFPSNGILEKDRFLLWLPEDCLRENTEFLDSQYGEIECSTFSINYDYGYCNYSKYETYSMNDYLEHNKWLLSAIPDLMPKGSVISMDTVFSKIKVLSIDKEHYVGKLEYNGKVFEHKISIPPHFENLVEKTDTTRGIITRIIYDTTSRTKISCYKLNTLKMNEDSSCYESLIVWLTSDKSIDSLKALEILNTIEFPLQRE